MRLRYGDHGQVAQYLIIAYVGNVAQKWAAIWIDKKKRDKSISTSVLNHLVNGR